MRPTQTPSIPRHRYRSIGVTEDIKLERAKSLATIFSAIAIPIVLTVAGYFIQRQLADEGIKKDYVGIAAGILKENPSTQEPDLRKWAIRVLEANSPVAFSDKAKAGLLTGTTIEHMWPAWRGPPTSCKEAPKRRTVYAEIEKFIKLPPEPDQKKRDDQLLTFLKVIAKQEGDALDTQAKLKCNQDWFNIMEQADIEFREKIGAQSSKSIVEELLKRDAASKAFVGAQKPPVTISTPSLQSSPTPTTK